MRICYNNLLDSVDISSVSGENSNFPSTNVQSTILTSTWRSLVCTTAQTITFDAGAGNTFTVTSIFVSNHNLQNSATIKFQMNATDAWGAPSINETLTWRAGHIYKFITSSAYRFIRFSFEDTTNPDEYIEIGRLFAGTYLDIDPSSRIPFKINRVRNDIITRTDQNNIYGTLGVSHRRFIYEFPNTGDTMIDSINAVYDVVGRVKPFYFLNYNTPTARMDIAYAVFNNDMEENIIGNKRTEYSLEIEECT